MDRNYIQYLNDARSIISTGVQACKVWSAPYDGLNPRPENCWSVEFEDEKDEEPSLNDCPLLSNADSSRTAITPSSHSRSDDHEDQHSHRSQKTSIVKHPEAPKQVEEMQKSASVLIQEESDFQHDVFIYNLVTHRDLRDDRQTSVNRFQKSQSLHTQTQQMCNHIDNDTPNGTSKNMTHYTNPKVEMSGERKSVFIGIVSDDVISNKHPQVCHYMDSEMQHPREDHFISQCLQLIRTLGGTDESAHGEDVDVRRLTALLYGEEKELDLEAFSSASHDDDDESNAKRCMSDSDGKIIVPFTGESVLGENFKGSKGSKMFGHFSPLI